MSALPTRPVQYVQTIGDIHSIKHDTFSSVIGQFSFRCFIGFFRFLPFSQFPET
jgi:hypothetical protein